MGGGVRERGLWPALAPLKARRKQNSPRKREVKPEGHLEVQLDGGTLVVASQSVSDLNVDLGGRKRRQTGAVAEMPWVERPPSLQHSAEGKLHLVNFPPALGLLSIQSQQPRKSVGSKNFACLRRRRLEPLGC